VKATAAAGGTCVIVLEDELAECVAGLGRQSAPWEACGVAVPLAGPAWAVVDCMNHSETPENSWEVPGRDVAEAIRIAMAEGNFFGHPPLEQEPPVVWHTHPGGHDGPSELDMEKRVMGLRHAVVSLSLSRDGSSVKRARMTFY